jgi:hypothetical protein
MNLTFWKSAKGCRDQPSRRFAVVETAVDIKFNQSNVSGNLRDVLLARLLRGLNRQSHQFAIETLAQTHNYGITEMYLTWTSNRITWIDLIATRRIAWRSLVETP